MDEPRRSNESLRTIQESDVARHCYLRELTGRTWTDSAPYDDLIVYESAGVDVDLADSA